MKRLICFLLTFSLCCSFFSTAFADYPMINNNGTVNSEAAPIAEESRAEETEWVFRWYDGMIQRRLWSITYGYWLTDWETIGYYDP